KYSQAELDKMYPQVLNEKVPTRVTPEQTYAKLLAALKVGDLAEASRQFVAEDQAKWLESLQKIKEKGMMEKMVGDLDKELTKGLTGDAMASYSISILKDGIEWGNQIDFIKDSNGDWKIKSL
ncbi:MAG: hypothetical protein HY982_00930, partial [Candidatus Magasanikbacteria bacterium]|nr:hypothetical protein [Candidatus Magasanikbacteria bacterium]